MTKQKLLYLVLSLILFLLGFFIIKTSQLYKENSELKTLLAKTITPIDLANWEMHGAFIRIKDIGYRSESPEYIERSERVDSLYKLFHFNPDVDSTTIISLVKSKLLLHDTLQKYFGTYPICEDGIVTMMTNQFFSHDNHYHYGDTVKFIFLMNQHLIGNSYEIVDFDNRDIASVDNNNITYNIPTQRLITNADLPKEVKFKYKVIVRNTYSNTLDTLNYWTTYIVDK